MRRLFVETGRLGAAGQDVQLGGAERHYLFTVLRLRPGDRLLVLDGSGLEAQAVVVDGRAGDLAALVEAVGPAQPVAGPAVTLLQGLPKGDKLDLVVEKATELGVRLVVPTACARSVPRPDAAAAQRRLGRWRRIAQAAARQCGRPDVPEVAGITDLRAAVAQHSQAALKLLLWEGARGAPLREALPAALHQDLSIAVLIGPEGGLAQDEVLAATEAGFVPCGLGPRLLRTETAGLAVLAVIQYCCA